MCVCSHKHERCVIFRVRHTEKFWDLVSTMFGEQISTSWFLCPLSETEIKIIQLWLQHYFFERRHKKNQNKTKRSNIGEFTTNYLRKDRHNESKLTSQNGISTHRMCHDLLSECYQMANEAGFYSFTSRGSKEVCGLYLIAEPNQLIRITFHYFTVDCNESGQLAVSGTTNTPNVNSTESKLCCQPRAQNAFKCQTWKLRRFDTADNGRCHSLVGLRSLANPVTSI